MTRRSIAVAVAAITAIGVWLHLPSLRAGLGADDYLQRAMLDGEYPIVRSPFDLYSFLRKPGELEPLMAGGIMPWWSHHDLRLSMLRPLGSASLYLDQLLGLSPFGAHVHSLFWLAILVIAYAKLAEHVIQKPAALIATAIVAFGSAPVAPVAWLCNRAALVSAAFGALGLYFYVRWRKDGWRPGAVGGALGVSLAFAAGEYGFGVAAFILAYELVARRDGAQRRALGLALALLPALAYLTIHIALGYGAKGSVVYIGPFDSPRDFLVHALERVPALVITLLLIIPGEWAFGAILFRSPLVLAAFAAVAMIGYLSIGLFRRLEPDERRGLGAFGLGALLGLLPLAGTVPSVRLLLIPGFGAAMLLASLIWDAINRFRSSAERRRVSAWLRAVFILPLSITHLLIAPYMTRVASQAWRDGVHAIRKRHLEAEIDDSKVAEQDLVLFNARGDIIPLIYPPWVRHERGSPLPRSWRVLASSFRPLSVTRISDNTLEITALGGTLFEDPSTVIFPGPNAYQPGDVVRIPGLEIAIQNVIKGLPTRVQFRFASSLDDPSRVFLLTEAGRIRRVPMPAIGSEFMIMPEA